MGRNKKTGLDYFPFDINFFQDLKVRKLIKYQGGKAVTVYALLLCCIYRNGYYMKWDEELPFIISEQTGFDEVYIREVIKSCLSVGLFSRGLYGADKILTSKGIQERYENICRLSRRSANMKEYNLISSEEVIRGTESVNPPLSPSFQSPGVGEPTKEEREKFLKIMFFKNCRKPEEEVENFINHYKAVGWVRDNGVPITDKVAVCKNWDIRDKTKIGRFPQKFMQMWKEFYEQLSAANSDGLTMLLKDIFCVEVKENVVRLEVTSSLHVFIEKRLGIISPLFKEKHFPGYKMNYIIKKP